MHVRVLAVGGRQPAWVDQAVDRFASRLPTNWRFELQSLPIAARSKNGHVAGAVEQEGKAILSALQKSERLIALDERGTHEGSGPFAARLERWLEQGQDLCFVIGGPDGLSAELLARAAHRWSLSKLTLPHGLARVLCVEQLYRAWSLRTGHPYHRA